jgi:curved DNA-binding protein CbpA
MREFINILNEAVRGNLSRSEAIKIFSKAGVTDPGMLDGPALKSAWRKLAMDNHPDRGGEPAVIQDINAAYDVLKDTAGQGSGDEQRFWKPERPQKKPPVRNWGNLAWIEHYFAEETQGMEGVEKWTVENFDGYFFRLSFTIPGTKAMFPKMAEACRKWNISASYDCRAIFVGNRELREQNKLLLIWLDGNELKEPVEFEHDSFNANPSNDGSFMRKLPALLDEISGR